MRWPTTKTLRDATMFLMGGSGFAHEVIVTKGERPTLLLACLALMGVPFFLRRDEEQQLTQKQPPQLPPPSSESPTASKDKTS